jgi:hypothetical protein
MAKRTSAMAVVVAVAVTMMMMKARRLPSKSRRHLKS